MEVDQLPIVLDQHRVDGDPELTHLSTMSAARHCGG